MASFYVSLSEREMARQIANMVNAHNKLYRMHSEHSIYGDKAKYFVEVSGNLVVGCAGVSRRDTNLSEVKHVCVHPNFRNKGIGKKLAALAVAHADTDYVYMTIRDDNTPSLRMAQSLGFVYVKKHWSRDHYVITVGRKKDATLRNQGRKS
jgi:ribosomal protein S18 acetylase RimI-like enzyme